MKFFSEQVDFLKQKNDELMKLNKALEKNQAVYIAHRDDKIDRALAKYINTYPEREKLNIMFLRESEGVYKFGSKKIYVKVEKGEQIFCRVGGGYMYIEDFIKTFTP